MSDDAEFKAIFTGDNSQFKTSVDETLAYLSRLVKGAYEVGVSLQDPVEMLQKFNNVSKEISSNVSIAEKFREIVLAATDVSPLLARISEFTGINFLEADANISVFKNGLLQLNDYSLVTKSAFAGIAEQIGKDNPILLDYAKVLQLIHADLSSLTEASSFFNTVQAVLKDPIQLATLAMEQFDARIVDTNQRLISLVSGLDTTEVKFTSLESYIDSISKAYKNAEAAILGFSEANLGNNVIIELAVNRLQQYFAAIEELKTSVRGYIQIIQDSGRAEEVFVNKKGEAIIQSRMLTNELTAITKALLSEEAILQVLNGTQDVSLKAVLSFMDANRSNNIIYQELLGLLPQVTAATITLTSTQKLLAQLLNDISSQFGVEFVNIFQAIVAQVTLTDQSLLILYSRFVTTAQAITQLLIQGQQLVGMFMNQVQAQNLATLSLQQQYTVIQQMIVWYANFKASLQNVNTVQAAMVGNQNNVTQSLLSQQTVMNSATGIYNNLLSANRSLVVVQGQTSQSAQSTIPPVQNLTDSNQKLLDTLANLKNAFGTFFNTLKNFAVFTAASAVITGLMDAFHSVINAASEFDQALHSLKAITGSTSSEMAGMGELIRQVASNTTYSTQAIGKGLQTMAQAGFTAGESVNTIKAASNLAMGTLEKLENTVDLLTSTLISYSLNTLEAGRVSDILATAVNQSKLSIDSLRTSLNYVGVIAAQSGLSLQETTTSLMVLADRGMKASTIGTGLRQVLDKLIAPNEKLRDAYQAHGISLDKISPLTAGYEEALKNLSVALYDSSTGTVNTAKAFELFGIRGAQAAAILIQSYVSGEWKDALNSLNQSGTAAKMAAEQMEGLSSKWDRLLAKASSLSASLGEGGLTSIMKGLISVLTSVVDVFQAFLNFDFGAFGTVTEILGGMILAVTAVTYAAKASALAVEAWVLAGYTWSGLLSALTTKLLTFYATLLANPFYAMIALVTAIIVAMQIYKKNIEEGIAAHNKFGNEAKTAASALDLFQKAIDKLKGDPEKIAVEVSRLKSEFPELVKEMERVANITDIASLSQEELSDVLKKVESIKLQKSLDEYTQAFTEFNKTQESSNANFVEWSKNLFGIDIPLRTVIGTSDKLTDALKNISKALIEQGKEVEGSVQQNREAALKSLEVYLEANKQMEYSRQELTNAINKNFDKEEERLQRARDFNQKVFNDIGQFYKDLSALERAEIQSTFDEQRKAEEKLVDMKKKGLITEEELQSSLYATKMRYMMKELALIDENRKKQYETSLEKYTRELALVDKETDYITKSLKEQQEAYSQYGEYIDSWNTKQLQQMIIAQENINTATELLEQKRRERSKITYEYQKKLADDLLKDIQANSKLQLSVLGQYENEKAKIELKTSEQSLQLIQKRIEAENFSYQLSLQGKAATAQQEAEHLERIKDLLLQETNARAEVITKTVASGQLLVDQLTAQANKDLETTKSVYATKYDISKQYYDKVSLESDIALSKQLEAITINNRDEEVVDDLKLQAKIAYWAKDLALIQKASEDESAIRKDEYEKYTQIVDQKLQVQFDFMTKVKGSFEAQSQYSQISEQQQIEAAQRLYKEQISLWNLGTSTFKSESGKRIQTIIDEALVAGKSIADQVKEHGIAYVKMTGITKEELKKQGKDFIETKDGIFQVITEQTLAVKDAALKETKAYKDGIAEKEKLSLAFVDAEIKRLGTLLSAVKKELASELAEHTKIVDAIKKVRENMISIHEKVEDAIREVRQTTMTAEKKYYDDIKIADEALNKARTTGIQKYVDAAYSKISSLATGTIKLDDGTELSAKDTAKKKEDFLKEYEKVALSVQ
jgi:TP901 family phage tail tape measure protein